MQRKRNVSLDFLRGVAIFLVLGLHVGVPYVWMISQLGVDLFFVLSGFLISGLLFEDYRAHGNVRLGRFWFRRSFKIIPPLYVFVLIMTFLMRNHEANKSYLPSMFFYMNYRPTVGQFLHTWSLSIEEQFYLVLPLLLFAVFKWVPKPLSKLPWILGGVIALVATLRTVIPDARFDHFNSGYFYLRCDPLFAGVLLRYVNDFRPTAFKHFAKFSVFAGMAFWAPSVLMTITVRSQFVHSVLYLLSELFCCCLLAWCFANDGKRLWSNPALRTIRFVGFYSYSIYLWHFPIVNYFLHGLHMPIAAVVLSITVGVVMAKAVEAPALHLRDRLIRPTTRAEWCHNGTKLTANGKETVWNTL